MDDDSNTASPCYKSANIDAMIVPIWTTRSAVIEGRNVNIALADDEIVDTVKLSVYNQKLLVGYGKHHDCNEWRNESDIRPEECQKRCCRGLNLPWHYC